MNRISQKVANANRRSNRVRKLAVGTPERPRLSVHVSNVHISAQIIDDSKGITLAYCSTVGTDQKGSMSEKAAWVGEEIASTAKKAKVGKVVFDRGARLYHGRIKILADAAREKGLEF
jgi:large subunit ribosomal protein L18